MFLTIGVFPVAYESPSLSFSLLLLNYMLEMRVNDDVVFQIGAFETTSAGCVAVGYPDSPDPPFVTISAPAAIGHCDDLTVEGSATVAFIGERSWATICEGRNIAVFMMTYFELKLGLLLKRHEFPYIRSIAVCHPTIRRTSLKVDI